MHHIFGGPFHDQESNDAFRHIQSTPHLIIDPNAQQERYAERFLQILGREYRVYQVASTIVKSNGIRTPILDMLYPPEISKSGPRWDFDTNKAKNKRDPWFSRFRIGVLRG